MRRFPLVLAAVAVSAAACATETAVSTTSAERLAVEPAPDAEPVLVDAEPPPTTTAVVERAPMPPVAEPDSSADRPLSRGLASGATAGRLATDGTPTFDGDFADPYLYAEDGTFYAYATNSFFTNVPVLIAGPDGSGAREEALPDLPVWSEPGHVWAPSVVEVDGTYVMHYTTRHSASGRQCISVAVADEPAGPFIDDSTEPLVCDLAQGGSIDPSVFVDGDDLWLLWKSDGNCCGIPTKIYAQPLTVDGLELAGDPVELIRNDLSWERDVVEGPSMIEVDGEYHLFYSANRWDTEAYAVGHALCETVTGPCTKDPEPWLADTDATSGPGGLEVITLDDRAVDLVVYHGWTGDEVGYPDGQRALYVRPIRWVDGEPILMQRGVS